MDNKLLIRLLKANQQVRLIAKILRFWFYLYTHRNAFVFFMLCKERKSIYLVLKDVVIIWRHWKMFPFHYFRYKLFLEHNKSINDLIEYIPEFYFDQILIPSINAIRTRLFLEDKVELAKLLNAHGINTPTTLFYSSSGVIFDGLNRVVDKESFHDVIMASHVDTLFVKPSDGSGGYGILSFKRNDKNYYSKNLCFDYEYLSGISKVNDYIVQAGVKQIDVLNGINSSSINTLRIISIMRGTEVIPLKVVLRMGRAGSVVDNSAQGSISCEVDISTWTLKGEGASEHPVANYKHHPDSNVKLDVALDYKEEALNCVKKVGLLFPTCKAIGWDIVLTPEGPCVIEINPGFG
ncbi:MAG: sugar-transfer associated ATP-grasp domain-containing protein, partial [Sedimenticola sp.]